MFIFTKFHHLTKHQSTMYVFSTFDRSEIINIENSFGVCGTYVIHAIGWAKNLEEKDGQTRVQQSVSA